MSKKGLLVLLLAASAIRPTTAQILHGAPGYPHGIPDICAGDPNAVVVAAGTTKTLDNTPISCLAIHGRVIVPTGVNARIGTLFLYPEGTLEGGMDSCPVSGSITFEGALDTTKDPEQFGIGAILLGKVRLSGEKRDPFVRLTGDVLAGAVTLPIAEPMRTWKVGDSITIGDTRQVSGADGIQIETRVIASLTDTAITLTAPLTFAHKGAHDPDGTLRFAPHIANITRSFVFRSANPAGVRGHIIASNRADIDLRYVALVDLGRTKWESYVNDTTFDSTGKSLKIGTNEKGRYALHLHHLFGPLGLPDTQPQFSIVGLSIINSSKWGVTLHNSHYGLVQDNVIVAAGGAGIMTEDGSETGNIIDHNFIVGTPGTGTRGDSRRSEFGFEGDGIWLRGPANRVTRNVAVTNRSFGISYFSALLSSMVRQPAFKGADPAVNGVVVDGNNMAVLESRDNEVYGASEHGFEYWWLGTEGNPTAKPNPPIQKFAGYKIWHIYHNNIWNYQCQNVWLDGFGIRGDLTANTGTNIGFLGGDYQANGLRIINPDFKGLKVGIRPSEYATGPQRIEGGVLQNRIDIWMVGLHTSSARADIIVPRIVDIIGTKFVAPPSGTHVAIKMQYNTDITRSMIKSDQLRITDYNGVVGDNVQVYYTQQAPSFVIPVTIKDATTGYIRLEAAPVAGLTNAVAWEKYGIAISGAVAPCSTTRPEVTGFVCSVAQ